MSDISRFDETLCPRFDLRRDLTPDIWARFAARARIPDGIEPLTALENLHLVREGQMTQAGAWLLPMTSPATACRPAAGGAVGRRGRDGAAVVSADRDPRRHQVGTKSKSCVTAVQVSRYGRSWRLPADATAPSSGTKSCNRCSPPDGWR